MLKPRDYVVVRRLYGRGAGRYEHLMHDIMEQKLPDRCRALVNLVCVISSELDSPGGAAACVIKASICWLKDHEDQAGGLLEWAMKSQEDGPIREPPSRQYLEDAPSIFQQLTKPAVLEASPTAYFLVQALLQVGNQLLHCMEMEDGVQLTAITDEERILRDLHVGVNCHIAKESLHLPVVVVRDRAESAMTLALKTQEELMTEVISTLPSHLYKLVKPPPPVPPPPEPTEFFSKLNGVLDITFNQGEDMGGTRGMDVHDPGADLGSDAGPNDPNDPNPPDSSSVDSLPTARDYKSCRLGKPEIYNGGGPIDESEFRPLTRGEMRRVALRASTTTLSSRLTRFAPKIRYIAPNGKYFTVKQLWECVSHYESVTREFSDWLNGIDCHHIFYEGLTAADDGTLFAHWGS